MSDKIIAMAKEAGFDVMATSNIRGPVGWSGDRETFSRFRDLVLEEALNCYSPDDTAQDWADKIRALKGEKP